MTPLPRLVRKDALTRAQQVDAIVREAIRKYEAVLNSDVDLRSIFIDVKLSRDGQTVRAAVVSLQGEVTAGRDNS
jgi:hypothetical protein